MRKLKSSLAVLVTMFLLSSQIPLSAQPPAPASPPPSAPITAPSWPRTFDANGVHVVVYQPQLKSWRRFRDLAADTAISITQTGGKPQLGVVSWSADTITDVSARTVYVSNFKVISARFPGVSPAQESAMGQSVKSLYTNLSLNIGLDRMIAGLEKVNAPVQSVAISQQVPTIMVSTSPSIVLLVDGKPVLAPVQGTTLQYVVNTNWDLFYDNSDYYLLSGKTWLKSKELGDRWAATTKLPADFSKLPADQNWGDVKAAVPPPAGAGPAPKVFYTEKPVELISFKGKPVYAQIPGLDISYATNTESNFFMHQPDDTYYVLISGRWLQSSSIDGPWTFTGNNLPGDFSRIPEGHPYSVVLVSVPGTQEASDAVLLAQVPTTAIVNKAAAEAAVKVTYAGDPQFKVIETTSMSYAVNTPQRVILVGGLYYLCYQGVWFVGRAAIGPWVVVDTVPPVIYTIPPASPVYNVTYVTVSNPTTTTIETSYSSGYLGMFVVGMAVGATIVYGTGYYYPPYIYYGPHPIYYPYPYTYGVAAVYNPYTGFYGVGRAYYGPYGSVGTAAWYNPATGTYGHAAAWYNPATGTYGRAVTTQNAYGGHTYAQAYNPWTGTSAATSQGHNQYSQWGNSVVTNGDNWAKSQHVTNSNGTEGSFQTSKGSAGAGVSGANGNKGFVAKDANNNNVYAGADGNVYKKDSNGDWSKYDNGSWTPVTPPTPPKKNSGTSPTTSPSSNSLGSTSNGGTSTQPKPNSSGSQQSGTDSRSNRNSGGTQQPAAGSRSDRNSGQTPGSLGSSDSTMGQLQNDSRSRDRGDQMEQSRQRGGWGGDRGGDDRSSRGGGGRTPRR